MRDGKLRLQVGNVPGEIENGETHARRNGIAKIVTSDRLVSTIAKEVATHAHVVRTLVQNSAASHALHTSGSIDFARTSAHAHVGRLFGALRRV